jgi:hypothetical protein
LKSCICLFPVRWMLQSRGRKKRKSISLFHLLSNSIQHHYLVRTAQLGKEEHHCLQDCLRMFQTKPGHQQYLRHRDSFFGLFMDDAG